MPIYKPYPVPTPYQPVSKGGNPYLKPGTTGQSIPATAKPTTSSGGYTTFNTGAVYPSTSVVQPTPQPKPQPQPQPQAENWMNHPDNNTRRNGYNVGDVVNGRRWNGNDWEPVGGSGGGSEPDIGPQLDAIYNPVMEYLSQEEQRAQGAYNTNVFNIEQSYQETLPIYEGYEKGEQGEVAQSKTEAGQTRSDLMRDARNMYNELQQGLLTRFGGASSTGQATQELLNRQVAQDMGGYNRDYQNIIAKLDQQALKISGFYNEKRIKLDQDKRDALLQIKQQLDKDISAIGQSKAMIQSEKAAKRLEALQRASEQARATQAKLEEYQRNLDLWKQAKDEAITAAKQFNAQSVEIPSFSAGGLGGYKLNLGSENSGYPSDPLAAAAGNLGISKEELLKNYPLSDIGITATGKPTYGLKANDRYVAGFDSNGNRLDQYGNKIN